MASSTTATAAGRAQALLDDRAARAALRRTRAVSSAPGSSSDLFRLACRIDSNRVADGDLRVGRIE